MGRHLGLTGAAVAGAFVLGAGVASTATATAETDTSSDSSTAEECVATHDGGGASRGGERTPVPTNSGDGESSDTSVGDEWELAFHDDFDGTEIDHDDWSVYNGGERRSENTIVQDGKLILRTQEQDGHWTAAGVSNSRALKMTYGKYVVRARFDAGDGVRAVALLWPTGHVWPPEVNFYEIPASDPQRTTNQLTNHYGEDNSMIHRSYDGDFTEWHDVGVEWTPDELRFTLDGEVMETITEHVPDRDMWLALQTATGTGGPSSEPGSETPSQVDMEIDQVDIYRYTGGH